MTLFFVFVFDQTVVLVVCVLSYITTYHINSILGMEVWSLALLSVSFLIFSSCIFMICRQPQTSKKVSFMVRGQNINIPGPDQSSADTLIVNVVFVSITGSSSTVSAHPQRLCQYLPHDSAEWRYMDTILCVDGCR